uniref:Histone deacetylase 14 n=1 Tax=Tanacetum cinerariifolium TaxID=118510 RepID=A0A699KNR9_TANCI|nr:hypothetical protein [Tanacetum cinerariifolium]
MADINIPANDDPMMLLLNKLLPSHHQPGRMIKFCRQANGCPSDTMCFNSSTGLYSCQLDEKWFNLHKDVLRDALDIIVTNDNNPFVAPPSSDIIFEYVNTLGYLSILRNVSAMSVNALYQPWKAILSMINMCLIGKTVGYDRPRHHVLQILWASRVKKKTTHLLIPRVRFVGNDGREIFNMPIPDALLTNEIKGAPYYGEYQEHVANYQNYLDAEHGKAEEGGATKSPKATKVTKPKAAKATKPPGDPKPKPAPTQPSKAVPEKKQKLVQETPNEPSPAKRSKGGLGLGRLVVISEPDSGRIQPLLDVQGKGKKKVIDEQDAYDLLTLLTTKNKIPIDQFIFQRRTSMPTEASRLVESSSLDAKLALTDSETESDDVGPNPSVQDKDQAGSNPGDTAESQPQSSHVLHAGPNLKHIDLEAADASTHQNPEYMDEEFTTAAYLNELSFTYQFFVEKQQEEEPGKTNAEAEV